MSKKKVISIAVFIALVIISLFIGVSDKVSITNLLKGDKNAWFLFYESRMPRTIVIILSASALSIAGLIMQALSRNKFISPQTAGTTNAAVLGVLIAYLFLGTISLYLKFVFAFVFAMVFSVLFILILNKIKLKIVIYVPLIGIMYGSLISAITQFIAQRFNALQIISVLNLGSFAHITRLNSTLLIILIPALVIAVIYATQFNVVSLGEDFSKNLGVNYKKVLFIGLIVVAAISASTYIVVGPLPFLGLIIPNLVSLYYGDNLKKNLFDVAIFGSSFVLLNDIISRLVIYPYEVAVGFTMGISGAVIFLIMIFRRVKSHE
ncbi:MAG: iron chelate uptake ABC transporter family permease subunit [Acholeplasma sp.]|nr:iron chelate uptake ABC transporter family permease subunit [Acholeplasma sp.]